MGWSDASRQASEAINSLSPQAQRDKQWAETAKGMEVAKFASTMKKNRLANQAAERKAGVMKNWDAMNEAETAFQEIQRLSESADPAAPTRTAEQAQEYIATLSPAAQALMRNFDTPDAYNEFVDIKSGLRTRMEAEGFLKPAAKEETKTVVKVLTNKPGSPSQQQAIAAGIPLGESARTEFDIDGNLVGVLGRFATQAEPTPEAGFTIGDTRYDAKGNVIVTNPKDDDGDEAFTLSKGAVRYDAAGNVIATNAAGTSAGFQPTVPAPTPIPDSLVGADIIDLSTVFTSSVKGAAENFGPTAFMVEGDKNVAARQFMAGLGKKLESSYINNPRVPVAELNQVHELGLADVAGSLFQSASGTRAKLETAMPLLTRQLERELAIASHPDATTRVRGEAQLSAAQLESAIADMKTALGSAKQQAVTTKEEYDQLKSGDTYTDSKGNKARKR
jgi:hypothetical protein